MDYGVKIGKEEEYPIIKKVPKNIVITHAHLDHAAYLPHLFRKSRKTAVYMTKPTRDLIQLMIADYMRVSRNNFVDNGNVLNNILKNCRIAEYGAVVDAGVRFSLHNSGHILGSSSVLVYNAKGNVLYTSDFSTRASRIMDPAEMGLTAKTAIVESTYGGKEDMLPSSKELGKKLIEIVNRTLKKNGRLLIPSFAVGRGQELILMLDSYMKGGLIEPAPIYIDGMIKKALHIFRHDVMYARKELQHSILSSDYDPFKSRYVFIPQSRDRKDAIEEGSIIITTSGMLKGGPVMTYLKELAGDKKNTLLFVGYQAPGTPGRAIIDGTKSIRIQGQEVKLKMKVEILRMSAHADHNGLVQYLNNVKGLEKVFIVHGEDKKRKELAESLDKKYEVYLPKIGEEFKI
ncbi:MAG: MBL fold metallo-hydrolase RNA specificity domain-containing protein [Candidatus Micrarchaeia archaeon]